MEKCRCCVNACRKPRKKRGGKKQKARRPQEIVVTLKEPTVRKVPRLAPTFESSIFSPAPEPKPVEESEVREEEEVMEIPSELNIVRRDMGIRRGRPPKEVSDIARIMGVSVKEMRKLKKTNN